MAKHQSSKSTNHEHSEVSGMITATLKAGEIRTGFVAAHSAPVTYGVIPENTFKVM